MKTLTTAKKPARKAPLKSSPRAPRALALPPAKATTKEWEADIKDGDFGAGVDWSRVARAVDSRSSSRRRSA
jgi:hypothetical protein